MSEDNFEQACDRLSRVVDAVQFERLRWARTEGPMLIRLAELAQAVIAQRSDFELTEEGSRNETRRFVLKVHGTRICALLLSLAVPRIAVAAEPIERSPYKIAAGDPIGADYNEVDEAWMARAFDALFARIEPSNAEGQ